MEKCKKRNMEHCAKSKYSQVRFREISTFSGNIVNKKFNKKIQFSDLNKGKKSLIFSL